MKFFLLLLLTTSGLAYWYQTTATICPVPLAYRIGSIDESFGVTNEFVRDHLLRAEAVWEEQSGRELFFYDETAQFTINFLFDDRQELADSEVAQRTELDAKRDSNEELFSSISQLQQSYESLSQGYQNQAAQYEEQLAAYNQRVNTFNDRGGAPANVFAELESERQSLDKQLNELNRANAELNTLAEQINTLSDRGNRLVDTYNREVEKYNEQFGFSREFTQGDYQGDRINIYKFSNDAELASVLAHEFGHALGIDHVEGPGSVMYYLLEESVEAPVLSVYDQEALALACGSGEEFAQTVRRFIRETLNRF